MPANEYSQMVSEIETKLLYELPALGYSSLVTTKRVFKPNDLPAFPRWCVVLSPPRLPWDELNQSVATYSYVFRLDLVLLVKNWDETNSLFGTTAPDLGLFQLVNDVKDALRRADLGGLISRSLKNYKETSSPVEFETFTGGFGSESHEFVHRALVKFVAEMKPVCVTRI